MHLETGFKLNPLMCERIGIFRFKGSGSVSEVMKWQMVADITETKPQSCQNGVYKPRHDKWASG